VDSAFFCQTLDHAIYPLTLEKTLQSVLQRFMSADSKSSDLVRALQEDLNCAGFLRDYVTLKIGRGSTAEDDAAGDGPPPLLPLNHVILLLGMQRARNLVVAHKLATAAERSYPKSSVLDPQTFTAENYLKRAIEAEEYCKTNRIEFAEIAFSAGLIYDWIFEIIERGSKNPKAAKDHLDGLWKQALVTAKISSSLGKRIQSFPYQKFCFAAGLSCTAGNGLMALLFEDWTGTKFQGSPEAQIIQEREKYGVSPEELLSLIVSFFPVLRPMEKAIRFYREPYFLKDIDRQLYQLAVMINIAAATSSSGKIDSTQKKWLKDIKLTERDLAQASGSKR
jgi:HD-like signal output (HDOD) protein